MKIDSTQSQRIPHDESKGRLSPLSGRLRLLTTIICLGCLCLGASSSTACDEDPDRYLYDPKTLESQFNKVKLIAEVEVADVELSSDGSTEIDTIETKDLLKGYVRSSWTYRHETELDTCGDRIGPHKKSGTYLMICPTDTFCTFKDRNNYLTSVFRSLREQTVVDQKTFDIRLIEVKRLLESGDNQKALKAVYGFKMQGVGDDARKIQKARVLVRFEQYVDAINELNGIDKDSVHWLVARYNRLCYLVSGEFLEDDDLAIELKDLVATATKTKKRKWLRDLLAKDDDLAKIRKKRFFQKALKSLSSY